MATKAEQKHVHDYTELRDKPVLLHDESSKLRGEESVGGATTGRDTLKQRVCVVEITDKNGKKHPCGAVYTYDLVRKKL